MSMTVTNVDIGNVILQDAQFRDDSLTFAGAGTVAEGTILARDSVSGALVAGSYRKERLVIDADGDDSNIDAAVIDQLRDYGLTPIDVQELGILDNQ